MFCLSEAAKMGKLILLNMNIQLDTKFQYLCVFFLIFKYFLDNPSVQQYEKMFVGIELMTPACCVSVRPVHTGRSQVRSDSRRGGLHV